MLQLGRSESAAETFANVLLVSSSTAGLQLGRSESAAETARVQPFAPQREFRASARGTPRQQAMDAFSLTGPCQLQTNNRVFKELPARERSLAISASPQRSRSAARLHNDGFAHDRLKILTQAYHSRHDAIGRTDVHEQHVVLRVMDHVVE